MTVTTPQWHDIYVTVVGDVMLDMYLYGKSTRLNPERPAAPLLDVDISKITYHLGGAANVTHNIRTLTGHPSLVGVVGNDHFSRIFTRLLRRQAAEAGIHTTFYCDETRPTTLKVRAVEESHNDQVTRLDFEKKHPIAFSLAKIITENIRLTLSSQHALVFSDYAKGFLTSDVIAPLIDYACAQRIPVLVDPKPANIDLFRGCTVITPNLGEAESIAGSFSRAFSSRDSYLEALCRKLQERTKTPFTIITCGPEGIIGIDIQGNYHHAPTPQVRHLFDVVGAGDAVLAVLALYFGQHYGKDSFDFDEALRLANLAGYIKVGKTGTSPVTLEELLAAQTDLHPTKPI